MKHIILLGDSILDNAAYVEDGPALIDQLKAKLPKGWKATLRAVDGSTTADIKTQLLQLPSDTSHLMISVGGNNALLRLEFLQERASSVAEVMARLAQLGEEFQNSYQSMLQKALVHKKPTILCTIYYPQFAEPYQTMAVAALTVFNDVILRAAFVAGLPVIDLRLLCNDPADYANPIEPSEIGGEKITTAIARIVKEHDFTCQRTAIYF
ncbi:MAG: SGNH/GDSL hydrolase family protein [Anaerolineae bacterium]|nr:SGNH/GDSL hydrolase family protein [Gloeobacterales cyanobacterium ES-bin-313]